LHDSSNAPEITKRRVKDRIRRIRIRRKALGVKSFVFSNNFFDKKNHKYFVQENGFVYLS